MDYQDKNFSSDSTKSVVKEGMKKAAKEAGMNLLISLLTIVLKILFPSGRRK